MRTIVRSPREARQISRTRTLIEVHCEIQTAATMHHWRVLTEGFIVHCIIKSLMQLHARFGLALDDARQRIERHAPEAVQGHQVHLVQ